MTHRTITTVIAAVAATAAFASAAPAQAPAEKPTPCTGFAKEDPAGDNSNYLLGNDTGLPSEANGDLLGVFFNRTAQRTTINLVVANVNKTVPPGANQLAYRVFYTAGGTSRYLETGITPTNTEPYFEYGTFETSFVQEGETPGMWYEGDKGVISIEIPAAAGGAPGVKFSELYMWPGYLRGGIYTITDYIPDGGEGGTRMTWNGTSCPEGGGSSPTSPTTPTTPVTPGPAPGPAPTNPNPGAPAQAQGPLAVSVKPTSLKAKKVKKTKKVALKMETKEQLKDVVVTLMKGRKALGSGKLASLTNISKLTLKLKKKGLKKGSYSLAVNAKRADGSTGTATLKLRVK